MPDSMKEAAEMFRMLDRITAWHCQLYRQAIDLPPANNDNACTTCPLYECKMLQAIDLLTKGIEEATDNTMAAIPKGAIQ